jgi:hypothetical protein
LHPAGPPGRQHTGQVTEPTPATAGYSGTSLPVKLGIKAGATVVLLGSPAGFSVQPLPAQVVLHRRPARGRYDVVLAFCASQRALDRHLGPAKALLGPTSALWLAWPKQASGVRTDLGESAVRECGLAAGLVDVKVAAIDAVWSGLKFVYRTSDRARVSSTHA